MRLAPFFKRFGDQYDALYGDVGSPLTDAQVDPLLPHLLGHALPALSFSAGRNVLARISNQDNYNMFDNKNSWPNERSSNQRWKHSDIKDVSYIYVRNVFDDFVSEGGLE